MSRLREVKSTKFDDLTFLVRPGEEFTEPPRPLQRVYRTAAYLGWRLKLSRNRVRDEQANQDEVLKRPLRVMFGTGPIAGVIRKGPRGARVSVTQSKNRVPLDPLAFLEWLGEDAVAVIGKVELDALIFSHPEVAAGLIKDVQEKLGESVELPVKLLVDHEALDEVVAARGDDTDPTQFFTEIPRGEPSVYAEFSP